MHNPAVNNSPLFSGAHRSARLAASVLLWLVAPAYWIDAEAGQITEIHLPDGFVVTPGSIIPIGFDATADGRKIVFAGDADIIPISGGTEHAAYLFDRDTNSLSIVSTGTPESGTAYRDVFNTRITADGRLASFTGIGDPENIIPLFTQMVWVRDLANTNIVLGSAVDGGGRTTESNAAIEMPNYTARLGRYVMFASPFGDFVSGDSNGQTDIFLHDLQTLTTVRISVDSQGNEVNGYSLPRAISPNSQFVYFYSPEDFIVDGSDDGAGLYVYDRQGDSLNKLITQSNGSANGRVGAVSGNSRYALYTAEVPYYYDAFQNQSIRLSDLVGMSIAILKSKFAMSDSGRFVVFEATEFFPAPDNKNQFVMLDTATAETVRLDTNGSHESAIGGISGRIMFVENTNSVMFRGPVSASISETLLLYESTPGLANVSVALNGPASVSSSTNQIANFEFVVTNHGSTSLTDAYLIFHTPQQFLSTLGSVSGVDCFNQNFHQFQCPLPIIQAGQSLTIDYVVSAGGISDGTYQIKYRAGSVSNFDVSPDDNIGSKFLSVSESAGDTGGSGGGGSLSILLVFLLVLSGIARIRKTRGPRVYARN